MFWFTQLFTHFWTYVTFTDNLNCLSSNCVTSENYYQFFFSSVNKQSLRLKLPFSIQVLCNIEIVGEGSNQNLWAQFQGITISKRVTHFTFIVHNKYEKFIKPPENSPLRPWKIP